MANIATIGTTNFGRVSDTMEFIARGPARAGSAPATRGRDQMEISQAAMYLNKLRSLPDVRQDMVDDVRAQIAVGDYATPEKIDQSLDGLFQDLGL